VSTTVAAGTPIRWHNGDGTTHTVEPDTAPPPSSIASIGPGGTTATQTIMAPGTYHYHCAIHPSMKGTLIVQ
jgi:plastocyanin